jgi:Transport and Golgi organisation 2
VCTLSWLGETDGYALYFNRDERLTRAPALPPTRGELDGVAYLAPTDGDFGGTWIGVNEYGVTIALLNRYTESAADPGPNRVSRGLLVRSLLDARTAGRAIDRLAPASLAPYQPFTLAAVDPGREVLLTDWTGTLLLRSLVETSGLVRTSSGRDQAEAERVRSAAWRAMLGDGPVTRDRLDRFHRSHDPERGAFSVCMHRPEAATRGYTVITVDTHRVQLAHVDGAPCEGGPVTTLSLPRRGEPA